MISDENYPALTALRIHQLAAWPDHQKFLANSFKERSERCLSTCEEISQQILKLGSHVDGGLGRLCADYQFLCEEIVLPEEEFFRRNGRYRLEKFEDALREVYAKREFMDRYMNGLLLSDVFWSNHAQALDSYRHDFLARAKPASRHLEVGPGHGLLLFFAAAHPAMSTITGWDVSPTSIAQTQRALEVMGITRPITLTLQNMFEAGPPKSSDDLFDSVVISEVLEHLEDPLAALKILHDWTAPGGHIWIHVPANSPAPDHLFLIKDPQEAEKLVSDAGFEVVSSANFPMSGTTLERAKKLALAVSCTVLGRKEKTQVEG